MARARVALLAGAAVAAVATMAACGQGGDADAIAGIVRDAARHPARLCTDYATPQLVARLGGRARCLRASRRRGAAGALQMTSVSVRGDTAVAHARGGRGERTYSLVKRDGTWRVNARAP